MVLFPLFRPNHVAVLCSLLLLSIPRPSTALPLYDFPYSDPDFLIKDTDIGSSPSPLSSISHPSAIIDRFAIDPTVDTQLLPFDSLLLPKP